MFVNVYVWGSPDLNRDAISGSGFSYHTIFSMAFCCGLDYITTIAYRLGFYRIVSTHSHFWLVRGYPSRSFPVLVDFPIKNFFLMALAKVRCVSPVSPQPHIIYRLFWTQPVWRERWFLALPTTELFSHKHHKRQV